MKPTKAPVAENLMKSDVQTLTPEMRLAEITALMLKHHLSTAPVVRHEGNERILLGFLSEADCLEHLSEELFYGNPSPVQTAETMMKRHPVCVESSTDLFALASLFIHHGLRNVPVVHENHLLGIVSRSDVLQSLDEYYRSWTQAQEHERHPVDVHQIMNHRFLVKN